MGSGTINEYREKPPPATVADCTVAVFAHNEQRAICKTLSSITGQTMPPSARIAEIIVVASGCTDHTVNAVRDFAKGNSIVTLIEEPARLGKAHAINLVLQRRCGSIIFLVPGDVVLGPGAMGELCRTLKDSMVGVACGKPSPVNARKRAIDRVGCLLWNLHNRTLELLTQERISTHACGEFMAVKRGIVERIDEDMVNDDAFIGLQASRRGFRVVYNGAATVYMKAPTRVADLVKQRTRVLLGHRLVKRRLGQFSRTLSPMMFYDPKRAVGIIWRYLWENLDELPTFILAMYLEAVANFMAFVTSVLGRDLSQWQPIESTKSLHELGNPSGGHYRMGAIE